MSKYTEHFDDFQCVVNKLPNTLCVSHIVLYYAKIRVVIKYNTSDRATVCYVVKIIKILEFLFNFILSIIM